MAWTRGSLAALVVLTTVFACSKDGVTDRGYRGVHPPGCVDTAADAGNSAGAAGVGPSDAGADADADIEGGALDAAAGGGGAAGSAAGGSPSSGGCGGSSASGGAAGAAGQGPVDFGVQSCIVTKSCDYTLGYVCVGYNDKTSAAQAQASCTGGEYAEEPCADADGVGACVAENGNVCTVSVYYSPVFDEATAQSQCSSSGGRFSPAAGCAKVTQHCDAHAQNGACAEYDKGYDPGATKTSCGTGSYGSGECDRKQAVGGCKSALKDRCAVVWYYSPNNDEKAVRDLCKSKGLLFVAP
jgi:hypothetical protein